MKANGLRGKPRKLVREMHGGEPYEYYPLGKYVVAAPGVCGGRPTFKYTRVQVALVLDLIAAGWTIDKIVMEYQRRELSKAAIREAIEIAGKALVKSSSAWQFAA